jgi:uncharacterized cupredoxin-like copper-binding protein
MRFTLLLAVFLAVPLAHAHGEKKHVPVVEALAEQTAWGTAGEPAQVTRTITIAMTGALRFSPGSLTVQEGETVRFIAQNADRMLHEMVIGTPDALAKHAAMMARFPNMEHNEAYMVHVDPGKSGEIVWHFNRAGSFEFACLLAGHYQAGMRGTITVTPRQGAEK